MLCYFRIYYSNITLKLTKYTTFYSITGVLILILSFIALPADGNHNLFSYNSYCLKGEYPKMMDQYVQYIEGSMKGVIYQDSISSLQAKEDFCSEHSEIYSQIRSMLPYESFNSIVTLDLFVTLISTEINELLHADFFFLFVFINVMLIGLIILKSYEKLKRNQPKERRGFTRLIRSKVLKKQSHKCDHCRRILTAVDFHHKNGDRSDNRERNCQALCPNCHAIETRGLLK
jgi:hypothetical protein